MTADNSRLIAPRAFSPRRGFGSRMHNSSLSSPVRPTTQYS